jgi:Protein of unknown function (DUF2934)
MNVARARRRQGTRSAVDPALDRLAVEDEKDHPSRIAELAYKLYEERGRQQGHQLEDWIEAERRISEMQESGEIVHS